MDIRQTLSGFDWGKYKKVIAFVVFLLALVIYFILNPSPEPKTASHKVVTPQVTTTKRVVKTPKKIVKKTSKKRSFTNLTDSQGKVYDALETNTRKYLTTIVGPSLMEDYDFDPEGKIKEAIKEYFTLSEEIIIKQFKNKIINTPLLDTIRNDSMLDLRMIVYK